jgi:hypothetical protein
MTMSRSTNNWLVTAAYGRDCQKRVSVELNAFYSATVQSLWLQLGESFSPRSASQPALEVVHSPVARPTTFRLADSETLVYDQYLGQVCNRLTLLMLEDASVQAVDQYVYKLYAQRSFTAGKFRKAALFGLLAKARSADLKAPSQDSAALVARGELVAAQETFVLGHELVHSHLSMNKAMTAERTSWYSDLLSSVHEVPFRHADFPDVSDPEQIASVFDKGYGDSIRSALRRRGISDANIPVKVRDPGETESLLDMRQRMPEMVIGNPELLEECVCDAFAFISSLKVLMGRGLSPVDVASGAILALHHLRLIQYLDRVASGRLGRDDLSSLFSLSDFFGQAAARISMLRAFVVAILVLSKKGDVARVVHQRLVELNQMHATIVFDQILHCVNFAAIESRLNESAAVVASAEDYQADRRALLRLLGFA